MDDTVIAKHLENLDHRLENVEQILPTLLTHGYLDERLAAQSAELRQEIRDAAEESRRHMDIIAESLRSDVQLLAEHAASTSQRNRTEQ